MERWFTPEDRLDLLRKVDHHRPWSSLDDRRICLVCERVFNGRQVEIEKHGSKYGLHCPTSNCPSDYTQWLVCGEPMPDANSTSNAGGQRVSGFLSEDKARPEPTGP